MHPISVDLEVLSSAQVILVDYKLEEWPDVSEGSPRLPICRIPANGLALASVLREHANADGFRPAVCLLSAALRDVYGSLSPDNRRHVLARQASLEWVFQKEVDDGPRHALCQQIEVLASGMAIVQGHSNEEPLQLRGVLLRQGQGILWSDEIEAGIDKSLPPINDLQQLTHGLAFTRWMLQRILPYPGFLLDSNYLAAKLGVTPTSLNAWIDDAGAIGDTLYGGVFAEFVGHRWWRTGIDAWLWEHTGGESFKTSAVQSALSKVSNGALKFVEGASDLVVCVGEHFESTMDLRAREECIAISPDDWPMFAERAFVPLNEARSDQGLKKLIANDEVWRLGD